jgi:hypothetical protein
VRKARLVSTPWEVNAMSIQQVESSGNTSTPTVKIEIIGVRFIQHPTLRASVDIKLGNYLTLRGFLVSERPGKLPTVILPSRERQGSDGAKTYDKIVEIDEPLLSRVRKLVLSAYANAQRATAEGGGR